MFVPTTSKVYPPQYCTDTSVCSQIALVSQSIELFSGSLRYNIEYGLKDCTADQVQQAAKKVNADDLISELKSEHDAGTLLYQMYEFIFFVTRETCSH